MKSLNIFLLSVAPLLVLGAPLEKRQGAGTGQFCYSVLQASDSTSGYAIENILDAVANLLGATKAVPPVKRSVASLDRRQLDKISNGAGAVLSAAGQPNAGNLVATQGGNVDGQGTSDQALVGQQVAGDEEGTGIGASELIPGAGHNS